MEPFVTSPIVKSSILKTRATRLFRISISGIGISTFIQKNQLTYLTQNVPKVFAIQAGFYQNLRDGANIGQ
jgi:hypothetical protein